MCLLDYDILASKSRLAMRLLCIGYFLYQYLCFEIKMRNVSWRVLLIDRGIPIKKKPYGSMIFKIPFFGLTSN